MIWRLLKFRLRAKHWKSLHSPFLLAFVQDGLRVSRSAGFKPIEERRKILLNNQSVLTFKDYGRDGELQSRKLSQIARKSLKPRKYAEIIANCCHYFKVENGLELGTSLGITTAYMAQSCHGTVYSFEGGKSILDIARNQWEALGISNIKSYPGPFDSSLDNLPEDLSLDLVFIDGHHESKATLAYFNRLLPHCNPKTVLVFDDIHWSKDMESAWKKIQEHEAVSACLDLYFIGIVFLRKELSKELIELNV